MPPAKMVNSDGYEVEYPATSSSRRRDDNDDEERNVRFAPATSRGGTGPIDLDDMFSVAEEDDISEDGSLFANRNDFDEFDEDPFRLVEKVNYFINPNSPGLLDNDASAIPGSPFSKPGNKRSTRPTEPLGLAKVASVVAFIITAGWIAGLIFLATFNYNNIGRIVVEILLALIAFLGLFWNTYFVVSSICKCFIPAKAFTTNTKYASIIPETKPDNAEWSEVTIQIPVYKESLQEVLMPTLKSCMQARDYYSLKARVRCNIVVCDVRIYPHLH